MPWAHCATDLADDVPACPACGMSKTQWTVGFEATRTFKLTRKAMLNLELVDAEGSPVAAEAYRATFADGRAVDGALDESGRAVVPATVGGPVTVTFADLAPADLVAPEGVSSTGGAFVCPTGRKQTFRLAGVLTEFALAPQGGAALAGVAYALTLPDGRQVEGRVDERLRVRAVTPRGAAGAKVRLDLRLADGHVVHAGPGGDATTADDAGTSVAEGPTDHGEWHAWGPERDDDDDD